MKSVKCIVHGKVQGVGYRYWTIKQAQELQIVGWVLNNPDGTVELVAQGEAGKVEELVSRLQKGPRFSNVSKVEVTTVSHDEYSGFQIRRS